MPRGQAEEMAVGFAVSGGWYGWGQSRRSVEICPLRYHRYPVLLSSDRVAPAGALPWCCVTADGR